MATRQSHRKLTKDLIAELCKYIGMGLTNKDAIDICGISESMFYEWLKAAKEDRGTRNEKELLESLKKAEAQFKAAHVANIMSAGRNGTWQASAWLLERKHPREYGRIDRKQSEHEVDNGMLDEILEMVKEGKGGSE